MNRSSEGDLLGAQNPFVHWTDVELDNGNIKFSGRMRDPVREASPQLCTAFLRLWKKDDRGILSFAKQWGCPLGWDGRSETVIESLDKWKIEARVAWALAAIAARVNAGAGGARSHWMLLRERGLTTLTLTPQDAATGRKMLAWALNAWYAELPGQRLLDLVDDRLQIRPHAHGLLAIIISQIAQEIVGEHENVVCANCKAKIPVGFKYCKSCRERRVPKRDASRRFRARKMIYQACSRGSERLGAIHAVPIKQPQGARLTASDYAEQIRNSIQDEAEALREGWSITRTVAMIATELDGFTLREIARIFTRHFLPTVSNLKFREIWLVGPTAGLTFRLDGPLAKRRATP